MSSAVTQLDIPAWQTARAWVRAHLDRIAYAAIASALVVLIVAATAGGILLHRSATIGRQTQRTETLVDAVLTLHQSPSAAAKAGVVAAYTTLRRLHPTEAARLAPSYAAFVRDPGSEQGLTTFQRALDHEVLRQGASSRHEYPRARIALITAVAAGVVLLALLVWQFDLQRRAGRIDRDAAERLHEVVMLRDRFVASVSHELRTPLTSILGYLELLRESPDLNDDDIAYLEVMGRNAERLMHLVSDLLLVAEAEGGSLGIEVARVELGALAADAIEAAMPVAAERDVTLVLDESRPTTVGGDPVRLAQLLDNLLSNAIKFTPPAGRVTVRIARRAGAAVVEVADTGHGIAANDRKHLFEPFYRATSDAPGTGLGLTISKAIVEAHGGSIAVDSTIGSGTTFRVELPVSR